MAKYKFKRGCQANYDALGTYDSDTLYFITDNHKIYHGSHLLSMVETAPDNFPGTVSTNMIGRYYISLTNGCMYYVRGLLDVVPISQLAIESIVLTSSFIAQVIAQIDDETLTLPTLSYDSTGKKLIWNDASVDGETVTTVNYLTPRVKN